ncbi:hypothetical protein COL8621_03471 [Actibacterium lipolyticum]|uniref:Uncharacterized protein n=1 Tax=Actibacterium lipolyticum TaxID=1524263 RepID=A0A238L7X1_9RHOB|nr:hypothetical protein COL8621_03471 [Actibacterium lipolyticum]
MGDERIHITHRIGDVLQRHLHHALPGAFFHLVRIGRTAAAIPYGLPLPFRWDGNWRRGNCLDLPLQMGQPLFPKRGCQDCDQTVILAVAIVTKGFDHRIGQQLRLRPGSKCYLAQQSAAVVKHADDDSTAVIAALEQRCCHLHEAPGQCECFGRIGRGDLLLDRSELALQIGDKWLAFLPIHKAAGPRDAGQPLGHRPPRFLRALRSCKFQPQPPFGHGRAGTDLNQQIGQASSAERLKVFCVQCRFRYHWKPILSWRTLAAVNDKRNADID